MRKSYSGFPGRSDTNRAVKPQKMARGMKFRVKIEDGSHYPCSENKGADQLRGYCAADLRLCVRIFKKLVFSQRGSNTKNRENWHIAVRSVQFRGRRFRIELATLTLCKLILVYLIDYT